MATTEIKQQDAQNNLTVFMLTKTSSEWLGMRVEERFAAFNQYLKPVLEKYKDGVTFRFYDTEFYTARVTDVWVWDVKSRHSYELAVEELRETPMWDRYFSIEEILAGIENAYASNYDREAVS